MHPTPVAIVGPTASGKSSLAIAVARRLGGEVVNIDSMQLYRGMDIGTAKLRPHERGGVSHHVLDIWDVTHTASVAEYGDIARSTVERLRSAGTVPVLVGGSMMYVQSVVDQWEFPPTDPDVRARYMQLQDKIGPAGMHERLRAVDPAAAEIIEPNDPRRNVRALEVIELTGKPFAASQPPKDAPPRWGTHLIGLAVDMEWLGPRIEQRTREMFDQGFIEEVRQLRECGLTASSTAGRAIGYAQVLAHLRGEISAEQAYDDTVRATRRYVRRQRSWFKRDPRISWIDAADRPEEQALTLLDTWGYHLHDNAAE
ncbi:tRNA dimethylallyltransferase [Corynebacterium ciconiae DSM 44920]|uniref:tRNA (adenosine(37)-N6)-dimethylallyltransferase MiaA n=1 Tax=Corynebacterium ciconiae TaxID=227319 RepID=UPI00035EC5D5|nr:tRNA (adenosine(37)-N6)-dimethylallyltransferase MiaA [Corynebacterium ciconiae]WKD61405.1 tRNA dimethylallyltransferase [Corynebacterium ciconiae DSM 44920]